MQNTNLLSDERSFPCKLQQTLPTAPIQQLFSTFGNDRCPQFRNTELQHEPDKRQKHQT
jgi:hypothetical protein